jgi:S1-C subfamily serine protease
VKEVLRRKAIREGDDAQPYQGRTLGDEIDIQEYQKELEQREVQVGAVKPNGQAMKAGMRAGDVIIACDNQPIHSAKELKLLLNQAGQKDVRLMVRRGETKLNIVVNADAPTLTRLRESYASPVFR